MDTLQPVLISQFHAALHMLRQVVTACPAALWNDPHDRNRFWHVAYHALFYTHLYLHRSEAEFVPWSGHRPQYNFMGALPWPPHDPPQIGTPYTQADLLQFLDLVWAATPALLQAADLQSADSGFAWLPFGKLELHIYTLRHLQQHTGELMERLGSRANLEIEWVGKGVQAG